MYVIELRVLGLDWSHRLGLSQLLYPFQTDISRGVGVQLLNVKLEKRKRGLGEVKNKESLFF